MWQPLTFDKLISNIENRKPLFYISPTCSKLWQELIWPWHYCVPSASDTSICTMERKMKTYCSNNELSSKCLLAQGCSLTHYFIQLLLRKIKVLYLFYCPFIHFSMSTYINLTNSCYIHCFAFQNRIHAIVGCDLLHTFVASFINMI